MSLKWAHLNVFVISCSGETQNKLHVCLGRLLFGEGGVWISWAEIHQEHVVISKENMKEGQKQLIKFLQQRYCTCLNSGIDCNRGSCGRNFWRSVGVLELRVFVFLSVLLEQDEGVGWGGVGQVPLWCIYVQIQNMEGICEALMRVGSRRLWSFTHTFNIDMFPVSRGICDGKQLEAFSALWGSHGKLWDHFTAAHDVLFFIFFYTLESIGARYNSEFVHIIK